MPIYEYECIDCGHRLEAIQKVADAPLSDCPACGKAGLKRLISAAGFQLKGTGWYVTDFKNSGRKQSAKAGAADKSGGEKKPGGAEDSSGSAEPSATEAKTRSGSGAS